MFYVGNNGLARQANTVYVGVNGVARKAAKAYIGVNGVARLCWSGNSNDDPYAPGDITNAAKINSSWRDGTDYGTITKITFTRTYTPTGAEKTWTIATGAYGSVKGFRIDNEVIICGDDRGNLVADDCRLLFGNCIKLVEISGLELLDTSLVTNMAAMFSGCGRLTTVNITQLNTSNVTNMGNMFGSCASITSLDLSDFDTSKVTDMGGMFSACANLTSINLSNFDTSKVTWRMTNMFWLCPKLTSLDLTSFDTRNVKEMINMFKDSPALTEILVSADTWVTSPNNLDMFYNCGCSELTYV